MIGFSVSIGKVVMTSTLPAGVGSEVVKSIASATPRVAPRCQTPTSPVSI